MTQTQTSAPAAPPPKPEDLLKRIEALEVHVGLAPKPPRKDTITAYYKDKKSGKTFVHELPPIVYEEAKNGRIVTAEQPSAVDDGAGRQRMSVAKWVVPEDADAWSLEDPDAKGHEAGKAK